VLSAVTVNVLRLRGDVSLAGPSIPAAVLEVAAGIAMLVAAGVGYRGGRRWLLAAAGAAWLSAEWASPAAPDAAALTVGLIVVLAPLPLVLASRIHRLREGSGAEGALGALAIVFAAAAALLAGPVAAATASPRDGGCADCAADLLAGRHDVALNSLLAERGAQLSIAAAVLAAAWLAARVSRTRPHLSLAVQAEIAASAAADAAAVAFAAAVAAGSAAMLRGGPADPAVSAWHAAASGMLLVLTAAVAWPAFRTARARRAVAAAVAAAADPSTRAVDTISRTLTDPALRIAYATADGAWRNGDGQLTTLPAEHVTIITDAGETVAALIHGSTARIDHAAVSGAVAAARLLLDAERLEAGTLARVNDLVQARQRVVEAADAARVGLERDLHDGAQQRLVALRYALGLAAVRATRLPDHAVADMLAAADRAAEQALADLRDLAHGVAPGALPGGSLGDAVRTAADQAGCSVTLVEFPAERLAASIEQAIYRFIVDCVRSASQMDGSGVSIAVRRRAADVVVELESDCGRAGTDWPPAHVADRFAAAGGRLERAVADGRERLVAVLPCE
jgi:signal transduction histidine kinase